mmetsp:Transcript_73306/g.143399  ORF Transcript_73306/g.143399 Transcript_73306/m.143399 type:complete len:568 (+) Transcript_73306:131-1834(+)
MKTFAVVALLASPAPAFGRLFSRQLSNTHIAGYAPSSDVSEHADIDLDMKQMATYLGSSLFTDALNIYNTGAYSHPYATITVPATSAAYTAGTALTITQGANGLAGSTGATGYLKSSTAIGATTLNVYYTSTCNKGGLATADQVITGCFDDTVDISVTGTVMTPSAVTDNVKRTLAGFSTGAAAKMIGQVYYQAFTSYYGSSPPYGDDFVTSALATPSAGGKYFGITSASARVQCAKKGAPYLNVWMYTIREMEDAIDDCDASCINCNDGSAVAWDEAVAFYAGSLEGTEAGGNSAGVLLYRLAEKRCENYGTCAVTDAYPHGTTNFVGGGGISKVNSAIMALFSKGLTQLQQSQCTSLIETKNAVVTLMTIPMIQGFMRYAYKLKKLQGGMEELAEGHVFAQAVLPRLAVCNATVAEMVKTQLDLNGAVNGDSVAAAMTIEFPAFKAAVESTYSCLGITCADIGGLMEDDVNGIYYDQFSPCVPAVEVVVEPVTNTKKKTKTKHDLPAWAIALIAIGCAGIFFGVLGGIFAKVQYDKKNLQYENMRKLLDDNGSKVEMADNAGRKI